MSAGHDEQWLTVGQAAARLGLSPSGFRGLAVAAGIEVRRRGRKPGVSAGAVEQYLDRARIRPGTSTREYLGLGNTAHDHFARAVVARPLGAAETGADRSPVSATDLNAADALGDALTEVSGYRLHGVLVPHLAHLQELTDEAGTSDPVQPARALSEPTDGAIP